ncbi:MAG: hypothetical protein HOV67_23515 [Kribbellaceae bacterium]|nr:hypothetical protein [Kribbellaceae bacterium]
MVSSFAELMRVQADIAVAVMRAHHSEWNGQYEVLPHTGDTISGVSWDGRIRYHPLDVVEPLQKMFARAYQQHDDKTLNEFREAIRTVLHENIHLLAAEGTSLAFPLDAYKGVAHRVFEEGVTERAAQNELNNFIDELDLERIAPGIKAATTFNAYAGFHPAVDMFTEALGEDVGLDAPDIIHRMAVVNSAGKFPIAAELLYTKHLSQLVPETAKADAISRIAEAMHEPFATIATVDAKDPSEVSFAALAGRAAFKRARAEVQAIAEHWSGNQDLRRALDAGLGATAAPGSTQRNGQGSSGAQTGGQHGAQQSRNTPSTDRPRLPPGSAASSRE